MNKEQNIGFVPYLFLNKKIEDISEVFQDYIIQKMENLHKYF